MRRTATIDEFTEHAAAYVRGVANGEECVITDGGEPVAVVSAYPRTSVAKTREERMAIFEQMLASARAAGPTVPPGMSVVEALSQLRDEREAALRGEAVS